MKVKLQNSIDYKKGHEQIGRVLTLESIQKRGYAINNNDWKPEIMLN